MKKWNMIVDVEKCENCYNCFLATKDEYIDNEFPGYTASQPAHGHKWVDLQRTERGQWPMVEANFRPVMCNHCDDAPCMKAAKDGAITKRDDGVVIIDPVKAKGQQQIVKACPYGAIYWNEEQEIPQAWIFDAHLLDQGWSKTRLENVCPTGVFQSFQASDEEMRHIVERDELEVLRPDLNTKPRVYYKNNHLFNTSFIGGTVITNTDGVEDCVESATVSIAKDGQEVGRAQTDAFGDFKIDKLPPNSGTYNIAVTVTGKADQQIEVDLRESIYLGTIEI